MAKDAPLGTGGARSGSVKCCCQVMRSPPGSPQPGQNGRGCRAASHQGASTTSIRFRNCWPGEEPTDCRHATRCLAAQARPTSTRRPAPGCIRVPVFFGSSSFGWKFARSGRLSGKPPNSRLNRRRVEPEIRGAESNVRSWSDFTACSNSATLRVFAPAVRPAGWLLEKRRNEHLHASLGRVLSPRQPP